LDIALVLNNITSLRHYPTSKHWYRFWQRAYRE